MSESVVSRIPSGKKLILFDGVCSLCDSAVRYVIKHDKTDTFRFASLQSDFGQQILKHIGIDTRQIDSIVLYEPNVAYYYKSAAALQIAKNLGGIFTLAGIFRIIPTGLANLVYDYVAKNRYKWYGKKEVCGIDDANLRYKIIA